MQNTLGIFEDRKEEINFYYSIMIEIESADGHIETIDNNRLVKIMKSNLLLMLYNLVEHRSLTSPEPGGCHSVENFELPGYSEMDSAYVLGRGPGQ